MIDYNLGAQLDWELTWSKEQIERLKREVCELKSNTLISEEAEK